jgi:hypothetical protein
VAAPTQGCAAQGGRTTEGDTVKYMIMTFGSAEEMVATADHDWIRQMIAFMHQLDDELRASGEMVDNQGLVDGSQAITVRWQDGAAVPTDGPFAEAKEALVGYWLVDVVDEARAIEIASRIVDVVHNPIEVRRVADAPPEV